MKLKKSIGVLLLLAMFMCVCFAPLSVSAAADFSPQQFLDKQLEAANITGVACVTKNGKVKMFHAYKSHILNKKTSKRKRNLRKAAIATSANEATLRTMMPYK